MPVSTKIPPMTGLQDAPNFLGIYLSDVVGIRKWAYISEEEKFLRVILLEDGETIHNAFFDRSFKENRQ
jgi:hypothetical protein